MYRAILAVGALLVAAPALAGSPYYDLTDAQKRKIVVPDIKALTYCVARVALNDADAVTYYRSGSFSGYISRQLGKCPREMNALGELYEQTYGEGEAEKFIEGPYLNDLPRAVLSIIKPQLDAKVADQMADEQRVRDAEAARDAEAKRMAEQERLEAAKIEAEREAVERRAREADVAAEAEARRKAEEAKLEAAKLQAQRAAIEDQARREKQARIETAMGALGVIRDKFYACVDQQLPGLVKSGEGAEVLGNAASTICGRQLGDVEDAAIEVARARGDPADELAGEALRAQVRSLVKERVVADAVQAKAGVGIFASAPK